MNEPWISVNDENTKPADGQRCLIACEVDGQLFYGLETYRADTVPHFTNKGDPGMKVLYWVPEVKLPEEPIYIPEEDVADGADDQTEGNLTDDDLIEGDVADGTDDQSDA